MKDPGTLRRSKTESESLPCRASGRAPERNRPIMKPHHLLLVASIIIPDAIAYVSSSESSSADAGYFRTAEGKNVALHRPCQPAPQCSAIVDSSAGTALILENGRGFMSSGSSDNWQQQSKYQASKHTFEIFLQQQVFVSHVVVLCSSRHSSNLRVPLRGTLIVRAWRSDPDSTVGNDTGTNTGVTGRITQIVPQDIIIEPPSSGQSEILKVFFQVGEMAGAISVEWKQDEQPENGNTSLLINEVMVMAQPTPGDDSAVNAIVSVESPEIMSGTSDSDADDSLPIAEAPDIVRIKPRLWTKNASHKQNHSLMPGDAKANVSDAIPADAQDEAKDDLVSVSADVESDSYVDSCRRRCEFRSKRFGQQKSRTTMGPKAKLYTTLAPAGSDISFNAEVPIHDVVPELKGNAQLYARDGEFLSQSSQSRRTALGYLPHALAALVSITVILSAIAPRAAFAYVCVWCRKGTGYQALPVYDPEARAIHRDGSQTPSRFQRLFSIGSQRAESVSPRFNRRPNVPGSPPLTESEPDGELEPLIASADSESQKAMMLRLEPAPVMLGMAEQGSDAQAQSNMFLAQCSRRVVLLYSSPLCYISSSQRPMPLPQIPFEREWEMIVRARDEANAALRITDQGHGRTSKRRSTAALEAQPLTATSLRRLVAPSPDPSSSGAATVLHLSAHGIKDCLVVENGKTTAHFLSCSVLREMLGDAHLGVPVLEQAPAAKLVVLNACSLRMLGDQFVDSGVKHVICSSAELRDSASHVFLSALYSSLFQGGTVMHAFSSALVALRSDPEARTQSAADFFYLLPEQAAHDEVLFWPTTSVSANVGSKSTTQAAPEAPTFTRASTGTSTSTRASSNSPSVGTDSTGRSSEGISEASRTNSNASNAFLTMDNAGSSTDGVDESCGSEGHADTSSGNSSNGRDGSDSDGSATENTSLLPMFTPSTIDALLPEDESPCQQSTSERRIRTASGGQRSPSASNGAASKVRSSWGCARRPVRPVRQQVMVLRKLPPRRCPANLLAMSPPEVLLSPFARAVPQLPEDFLGRSTDVWSILQHLCDRRAVVVSGAHGSHHGIGKSVVLDAVHRAFALQMGGICVTVQLKALSDLEVASASSVLGWIDKVRSKVQSALEDFQDLYIQAGGVSARSVPARRSSKASCLVTGVLGNSGVRRRKTLRACQTGVSHGFHPLSDPIAAEAALEELVAVMSALSDFCEECNRECPAGVATPGGRSSGVRILLLLDECDHLIQQRHFQDAIAEVLRNCASYSIVLSTQQQMVETGGGWFKAVHQPVAGLPPKDAALLFLRRCHRPLYWDELLSSVAAAPSADSAAEYSSIACEVEGLSGSDGSALSAASAMGSASPRKTVVMTAENESEVLARVVAHPAVAAQMGNPRRLIELASQVRDSLPSMADLPVLCKQGSP